MKQLPSTGSNLSVFRTFIEYFQGEIVNLDFEVSLLLSELKNRVADLLAHFGCSLSSSRFWLDGVMSN